MVLKEPELFDYLKEFHYSDLRKSEDQFDSFDCISDDHKMYIELKSRNTHYDDLLIEEPKYKALMSSAGGYNLRAWYINATPSGIWGFDLEHMPEPKWEDKWLPTTTEFARRGNKTKLVGFLNINDGILL